MPNERTWPDFKSLPPTAKFQQLLPGRLNYTRLRDMFPEEKQGF
jgi:hypothetical protein